MQSLNMSGKYSLHRVSPISGDIPRVNAILTYENLLGKSLNAYSLRKFFGREIEEK